MIGPRQEVVDLAVEVAVDDPGDDVGQIVVRFDAAEFAGLYQGRDDGPAIGAAVRCDLIMPGVWGKKLRLHIRSIRYFSDLRS